MPRRIFSCIIIALLPLTGSGQDKSPNVPGTIFWKIYPRQRPEKISYLLGTNHTFGNGFIDSVKGIESKLALAELFVCESGIKPPPKTPTAVTNSYTPYTQLLNKNDYKLLDSFLVSKDLYSLHELDSVKFPVNQLLHIVVGEQMIAQNKSIQASETIMDTYLEQLARARQMPVHELDSGFVFSENILKFGGENKQIAGLLIAFIKSVKSDDGDLSEVLSTEDMKAWRVDYKFDRPVPVDDKNGADLLLVKRNAYWLPQLQRLLQAKKCFIAVGIEHLKYNKGLLKALQQRGFVVMAVGKEALL